MVSFSRFVLLCSFVFFSFAYAQENSQKDYYTYLDNEVGIENTGLYNGILYEEKYRTINEKTQFFNTRDFKKGSVCYDGQCYYNLELSYNVYEDEVLLKLISKAGGGTLKLYKGKVESFKVLDKKFIKIEPKKDLQYSTQGYHEVIYESSDFSLYAKHFKKIFKRQDRSSLYYEFVDDDSKYVLNHNNNYNFFNTKKEIIAAFPELKKEIDKFYSLARGLRKSDPNGFRVSLLKRIEILLSQNANQTK